MKVLYVSKASVVAAHCDKLRWLAKRVELEVVVPNRWSGSESLLAVEDVSLTPLPVFWPGHNHFHLYRGLGVVMDRFVPDLIHLDEEPYSAVTFQAGSAARRRGIPFVFFAAQNIPKRYPPPFHSMRRWVFDHAAGGIAGTGQAADVLLHFGFRSLLRVVPQMGVDPAVFRADARRRADSRGSFGCAPDAPVVAFIGRLVREKGIDLLLRALATIPELYCVIAGSGPEEGSLRKLASALGIESRVRFMGHIPSMAIPGVLAGADLLCLPSRNTQRWSEQFGRVLVEAMSTEVPVVVTDCGGMPGVVGDCGKVVPMDDVDALSTALEQLASDQTHRVELGRCGRARVIDEFSQHRIVEDTLALYKNVLERTT